MSNEDGSELKLGDIVEYVTEEKVFEDHNGTIGILVSGPVYSDDPEWNFASDVKVGYRVAWIVYVGNWEQKYEPGHLFASPLLKLIHRDSVSTVIPV